MTFDKYRDLWFAAPFTFAVLSMLSTQSAASQTLQKDPRPSADMALSYVGERAIRVGSSESFGLNGGSAEVGFALWKGLGPAVNVTGVTAGQTGANGAPLSLVTWTMGPRLRLRPDRRLSPYGEALLGVAHGFDAVFPSAAGTTSSADGFALQAGGGLDLRFRHMLIRPVELAYVQTRLPNGTTDLQHTLRIGAGVGLRFGRHWHSVP